MVLCSEKYLKVLCFQGVECDATTNAKTVQKKSLKQDRLAKNSLCPPVSTCFGHSTGIAREKHRKHSLKLDRVAKKPSTPASVSTCFGHSTGIARDKHRKISCFQGFECDAKKTLQKHLHQRPTQTRSCSPKTFFVCLCFDMFWAWH